MLKLAVLVSGNGTNLQSILNQMEQGGISNVHISVVISSKKHAFALKRAQEAGIETVSISPGDFETKDKFNKELIKTIKSYKVDLIVLAGYQVILSSAVIQAFPRKIIAVHPSILPSFCGKGIYGRRVYSEILERGVRLTGATVYYVDSGIGTGPIILQKALEVRESDTVQTLQKRVMEKAEWVLLPKAIDLFAHKQITLVNGRVHIEN